MTDANKLLFQIILTFILGIYGYKKKLNNEIKISRVAIVIVFLALIRCISEIFRLKYYSSTGLTYEIIKPFLIGALVTSVTTLIMVILSFYSKYKIVIAIAVSTIYPRVIREQLDE